MIRLKYNTDGVRVAVNSDRELAEHIVCCLRSDKLRLISESVSPNFVFSSPRAKGYNFNQYCQNLEKLSIYIDSEIINVKQFGDVYEIDLAVQTIDIKRKYFDSSMIKALVTITDHMIQSVELVFEVGVEDSAYMEEINPIDDEFKPD